MDGNADDHPQRVRLEAPPGMSRNQFKKQMRKEAAAATWDDRKEELRLKQKEKRRAIAQAKARDPPVFTPEQQEAHKKKKIAKKTTTVPPNALRIYIDCEWEDVMHDKECQGIAKQIRICHGINRSMPIEHKIKFRVTSLRPHGAISTALEATDAPQWVTHDADKKYQWFIDFCEWDYREEARREQQNSPTPDQAPEIIYLTADAEEELEDLDENCIYILGGLLDHNRYKSGSWERAVQRNVRTARLPLGKYVTISRRPILTVNHVFEILAVFNQTRDWEKTFLSVLPPRMEAKSKSTE